MTHTIHDQAEADLNPIEEVLATFCPGNLWVPVSFADPDSEGQDEDDEGNEGNEGEFIWIITE